MYDTILVPTDGSDHAVRAAEHALSLARAFDATVHVLNVVDVQAAAGLFDAGGVDEEFVGRLEAEGERAVAAVEALARTDDEDVRTDVVKGHPADAILTYAADEGVDLIAMGTHGRRGLDRVLSGSVTERVVRRSDRPVLTVRDTGLSQDTSYDDVLVPTDGSDAATAAVDHAVAIAARYGARVHALNVVDVGHLAASPDLSSPTEVVEHFEAAGEDAVEAVATRAREAGLDARAEVREGFPAREVLDYATDEGVDLIAMGTHGRTGLDRFLLGSTTERTLERAEVPVLAVRAGERSD